MDAGRVAGEVFVEQWLDLRRLPLVMDDVGEQAAAIVDHAVRWVARPDGFEPSPLCLLRPLASAMEIIGEAFAALGDDFGTAWHGLREAVAEAERRLEASDADSSADVTALADRLVRRVA